MFGGVNDKVFYLLLCSIALRDPFAFTLNINRLLNTKYFSHCLIQNRTEFIS